MEELTAGFRVPREVIAYASRLLPHMSPGLAAVESVRENPGSLDVRHTDALDQDVVAACVEALAHEGSVGLIAADARIAPLTEALTAAGLAYLSPGEETTAESRLTLVPASLAKGLEYDYVVLDEAGRRCRRRTRRTDGPAASVRGADPCRVRPDGASLGPDSLTVGAGVSGATVRLAPDPAPPRKTTRTSDEFLPGLRSIGCSCC